MEMRLRILGLVVSLVLLLAACSNARAKVADKSAPTTDGDPEAGKELYLNAGGCVSCHTIDNLPGAIGQVGPDHTHIATRAEKTAQKAGVGGAEEYIRQSILNPDAYIAPDCPQGACDPGIMHLPVPPLTEQQIDDLVAFLMQQK